MRGGLERWKRGVESQGVRQAIAYAFKGTCDSHLRSVSGVEALAGYSGLDGSRVERFTVEGGEVASDHLNEGQLRSWVDGHDPLTGDQRGRELTSPDADLILDGTINAPKSYSIAALIHPQLAKEFEALQDHLRDRIIRLWQQELNARRGAGGSIRESLRKIEVVELRHRRSRALDPHIHRHLWLNVKVLGDDGKWSNVDSRVAMKLHTVINAEGELAARTDPAWINALAAHGYTLDDDGEIAQLAHAVRPLSRRSNQIEANRAVLLARWRDEHPGQDPDHDVMQQIDRMAWAQGRPNKPGVVDEAAWEQLIRDELAVIDSDIFRRRHSTTARAAALDQFDLNNLAARAVVDADERSAACGGRFSRFDLRAGAIRALAATGVVADRDELQPVVDDILSRTSAHVVNLIDGDRPAHVKGYMAAATARLKLELAARLEALAELGWVADWATIVALAARMLPADITLDEGQVRAASAIAGTDRLVSVTGPAGAGKTTMLRVARATLAQSGRRLVVVAPTKKAASVAGREIGATASSLHALLGDHGWRWGRDDAGAEVWTRLRPGEADPRTGLVYDGPRRFPLTPGDRVVVDEAGMVDLHTANALAIVASETGIGIAMIGDHLQAMPVGHSGAMACLTRRATAVVELTAVHRFRDPEYASLTLRLREPSSREAALAVAAELDERGLIHGVVDTAQARDVMVEAYFRWADSGRRVALVTSTNEEADGINEAIQQSRVDRGQLSLARIAVGQGEQRLLEGDVVQTRRNDHVADVENRALWTVRHIRDDGLVLASVTDSADLRLVGLDYAASHVHLAYASTVHGIQGETTDASVVGPGVGASGLYVGMTRGRQHNEAIAIARTTDAAREAIADSMMRGTQEVTIDDAVRAAREELWRAARPAAVGAADNVELALASMGGWIRSAGEALRGLDASAASTAANAHARNAESAPTDEGQRALLAERIGAREAEFAALEREYEALLAEAVAREPADRGVAGSSDAAAPHPSLLGSRAGRGIG
ncbi:AAA family ATPase [Microbacterium immunditiarum]|uniref:TrwC relaxase domain-containing protein n=1 Tax=Microbacterium immunditiarum TaxID=337480 RepID=A0A7Y9KHT3_9MICO|nr:AAA family ATPase [Microbacterium immunditiarum]NYE18025.1 hypothetical protein [Microbacterium immunditiarum]